MLVTLRNNVSITGSATGRPIVFAHGFGCDQTMWRHVARLFEHDHRVVVFDHVGAGGSDLSDYTHEDYDSLDAYAEDVVELLDELGLRDVVFVGHSVSAMIGVLAANQDSSRFGALVLVGPSPRYLDDEGYTGGFTREDIDGMLATMDAGYLGWSAGMAPAIMGNAERPELGEELTESFCRTDPEVARQFASVTFLSDNREDLARLSVPALILQCQEDIIAPLAVGEYVHANVPGSTFVQLEARGHCPNLSAPGETAAAIRAFLA